MDDRLGRYVLVEHIATGGMGEIWLALDPDAGRVVAIKRLRPELANTADVREMFDDEARLSARLDHPSIVRVYSFEVIEKERLIVMEYILGVSAKLLLDAATMRQVQVPLGAALRITSQAARALHYAHELTDDAGRPMNLVHRDITPHNLLVSLAGEVKIVDFGIAKASTRIHQTQHGMIKGKTSYMSPEQCTGLELDRRTDVFSLGIVLYELITGHRLFQRASDIDIVYLYGYGFPRYRGGPMFYADSVGLDKVLAAVQGYHEKHGKTWKPAALLEKLAAAGGRFNR